MNMKKYLKASLAISFCLAQVLVDSCFVQASSENEEKEAASRTEIDTTRNESKNVEPEFWQKMVHCVLSDFERVDTVFKKLQIYKIPKKFKLSKIKIWRGDCEKNDCISWSEEDNLSEITLNGESEAVKEIEHDCNQLTFNEQENSYEIKFDPGFFDKKHSDNKNLVEEETEQFFDLKHIFYCELSFKDKATNAWLPDKTFELSFDDGYFKQKLEQKVRCVLSDCEKDDEFIKKLQIFDVPDEFKIDEIRIWPSGVGRTSSIMWFECDKDETSEEHQSTSELIFNDKENCYELKFTPSFFDKMHFSQPNKLEKLFNFENRFNCELVFEIKKTNNRLKNELIRKQNLKLELDNKNLKEPTDLESLNNLKFSYTKNSKGEDCLKIEGISNGVDEITVDSLTEDFLSIKTTQREVLPSNSKLKRDSDGNFYLPYTKQSDEFNQIDFHFKDPAGFDFIILENFKL